MRIDSRAAALAVLSFMVAAGLGYETGLLAGLLTALAGLVSVVLWELSRDRQERTANAIERREAAVRAFGSSPALAASLTEERGVAWYLRPEAKVVGFWARPELDLLRVWCTTGGRLAVRLVTGPGGSGKTRLALQLAADMEAGGWRCMWVDPGREQVAVGAVLDAGEPAVLIVDYAETRTSLGVLLADAVAAQDCPDLRIVLLARTAGEWWQKLAAESDFGLSQMLDQAAPLRLGPLTSAAGQQGVFEDALTAFADELGTGRPDARLMLDDPDAVVLVVHAAALLAVLDHAAAGRGAASAAGVLTGLLGHESRYWHKSAVARGLILDPAVERLAVAVACLAGAGSEPDAAGMLARVPDLADSAERRGKVARWLHDLYPAPAGAGAESGEWLGSLRPDRLSEHLVTGELSARPGLVPALLAGLDQDRLVRALTVLGRAALADARAGALLRGALDSDPENLCVAALTIAVETNPAVADMITGALAIMPVERHVLVQIADGIPYPTFALAGTAVQVLQRLAAGSAPGSDERAVRLNDLSNYLSSLGRREEALAAIEEAVTIRRELAAARPDASLPHLATSLNTQSVCLSELGRREEALAAIEEAVTIYRELAAARPDAFLPDLAASLNNHSNRLSELGRREEALAAIEEAVTIHRELAAARPDALLPDLAMSLNNQSIFLAELGRREEALAAIEEAATAYRELAAARPDAFLPDLAMSLNNQCGCLAELGRWEEALAAIEEAVTAYRELAAARPDAFLPDLAASLSNQSRCLAELGGREEALAASEEAVSIRRELAAARPDAFLPDLAASLNNHSNRLSELGRREEALAAIEEAVTAYREMARARPVVFASTYADSLENQALILSTLGRDAEAQAARSKAAAILAE